MHSSGRPSHKGKSPGGSGGRPNTIGLGHRELDELLDRLESPEGQSKNPKRDFIRSPFRQASVKLQIMHPGGVSATITVACRNISRTGIAILHSAYAHTGTKCRILLPHPERGEVPVDGWVTRCSHRSGVVHEVGIRFDQPINVQEYLRADPFSDWFSLERVNPEDLAGTVVYVEDSDIDRKIIRHFLRDTKLNVVTASSGQEAISCIDESVDLVMIDFHLGDMNGGELAAKLRDNGFKSPILILTCDTQSATTDMLEQVRANAFLAKPVNQDQLLRAIGEFLIVQKAAGPAGSRAAVDPSNSALTEGLQTALNQYAKKLEDCVNREDATAARTLCLQIAGTAGTLGVKDVNQLATKAAEALTRSGSVAQAISSVRALIAVCKRSGPKSGSKDRKAA